MPSELVTTYKGGTILAVFNYISMFLNISVTILMINSLGPTLYGIRGVLIGSYTLIYSLFFTAFGIPYTRELSWLSRRDRDAMWNLASNILTAVIALTVLSSLTYFLLGLLIYIPLRIYENIALLIILLSISLIFEAIIYYARFTFRSLYEYKKIVLIGASYLVAENIGYIVLIAFSILTLETIFITMLLSRVMGCLVSIVLLLQTGNIRITIDRDVLKKYFKKAGLWTIGSTIYYVFWNIDSYVLPYIIRGENLGYYYFVKLIISLLVTTFMYLRTFLIVFYSRKGDEAVSYLPSITKFNMFLISLLAYPLMVTSKQLITVLSLFLPTFSKFIITHFAVSIAIFFGIINEYLTNIATYSDSQARYERHIFANSAGLISYIITLGLLNIYKTRISTDNLLIGLIVTLIIANFVRALYWQWIAIRSDYNIPAWRISIQQLSLALISFYLKVTIIEAIKVGVLLSALVGITLSLLAVIGATKVLKVFNTRERVFIKNELKSFNKYLALLVRFI